MLVLTNICIYPDPMTEDRIEHVAREYVRAVGLHELSPLDELLAEDLVASFAGAQSDKATWIAALGRLLPALIRNDIRETFVRFDRACIVYDFVTRTPAGSITCIELLTVRDGRIADIELLLDRAQFGPVNAWLAAN